MYCQAPRTEFYRTLLEEYHLTPQQVEGFSILQLIELFGGGSCDAKIIEDNDEIMHKLLIRKGRLKHE